MCRKAKIECLADISNAFAAYRAGEQTLYEVRDLGTSLSDYYMGEKMIDSFDVREAALLQYRLGEKELIQSVSDQ